MIGRKPFSREKLVDHLARSLEQLRGAARAFCCPPEMKRPTSLSLRTILIAAVVGTALAFGCMSRTAEAMSTAT